MTPEFLLSTIVFLPAVASLGIMLIPSEQKGAIRWTTLAVTAVVMALIIGVLILPGNKLTFSAEESGLQSTFNYPWIPSFQIDYFMGLDGISFPLVALTAFVSLLAMGASWNIDKFVKGYCVLFLLLETGMLGVFVALDFFLFYVFWEVMLLPMYFLIGVWGGPRKEYAAIKFFLYTLVGSVLMLIAILMLYFSSDLSDPLLLPHLEKCHLSPVAQAAADAGRSKRIANAPDVQPVHTFNIMALQQIGQHTDQLDGFGIDPATQRPILFLGHGLQWWAFLLLFIGFAIKVPSVPVHTWLPDAHVEAPTPISMILAGVLLKMGGYGILRICYPICPHGGYDLMWFVCILGVVSMIYGAFAAMAQTDFKRMVAYSSVSHMGYVVLGMGVWSALARNGYQPEYWNMGVQGAMFQMIAHGISSAGMFFMVGVLYDRVHHRNLNEFGGIFGKMPYYTAMAILIFFAGLGLPGLCGFIGEVFVVLSVWKFSYLLAVLSAAVVILTAGYILWAVQRVYLGAEYKGPHGEHLHPSDLRENLIGTVLCVFAILFGVFPYQFPGGRPSVLKFMDATIDAQVQDLADWTRETETNERAATASYASPTEQKSVIASLPSDF
ncbi:MAG TPA: NADH-quinone oxidoreductase subunit M [Pirellulaceae bacterium]|nr:NADH-quinone oxidoreductase subunit M [Pirellulaceae bacterium]